ncbi:MAG: radical SAM family heme chaperone HemW [Planctomycetota bacterium]|jgi:oxygen-independent coproporphyrinogen-3 oxidase
MAGSGRQEPGFALYVHVPFCTSRCSYCDFTSEVHTRERVRLYLDALAREAERAPHRGLAPATVYVGGGTPTSPGDEEIAELFGILKGSFDLSGVEEWTVEANPGTIDERRLALLRELGADRLSLGTQSFRKDFLRLLGRRHGVADSERAVRAARAAGFDNVSLDLIFAMPGQTLDDVKSDVARAVELAPDHVSLYSLTYEPGTKLHRMRAEGAVAPPDEELEREMYLETIDDLLAAGFEQYEISNFARPGYESRHNLVYWEGALVVPLDTIEARDDARGEATVEGGRTPWAVEYVGLGPSAASFVGGERRRNLRELGEYASRLARGEDPVEEREQLGPERAARETLMLALRTRRGVAPEAFERRTGFSLEALLGEAGRRLFDGGWLERTDADGARPGPSGPDVGPAQGAVRVRLSRRALPVADAVLAEII